MSRDGIYFSSIFGVDPQDIFDYGAFNISLISDLPLFVDPFLLFQSNKHEYQELHKGIIDYLKFLLEKSHQGNVSEGLMKHWYYFSEIRQNWLGFSLIGNQGSGLGSRFANSLHKNLNIIFSSFGKETISKGTHLEKVCLIDDGVGRDNISDFTTNLIKEYLLKYTENFTRTFIHPSLSSRFHVDRVKFNYSTETWERGEFLLPIYNYDYVILTPRDILTRDDTWISNPDLRNQKTIFSVAEAMPNIELRSKINQHLNSALRETEKAKNTDRKQIIKVAIDTIIRAYPEIIDYYIRYKEDIGDIASNVSQEKVDLARTIFEEHVVAIRNTLESETKFYSLSHNHSNSYDESLARVLYLKDVIENKGGHRIFEPMLGRKIRESDVQIIFKFVWYNPVSDVSREVNDGRGPVDFKISRGSKDKTLVEFKLASNSKLKQNLQNQVEIYKKASDAKKAIHVIVFFNEREQERVSNILRELDLLGNKDIVLIDARQDNKPSGSTAHS